MQFSPDMMCLTSLNFLGIYCELDASLCSILLLVRRCGSVSLPCSCSRRVMALGASGAICSVSGMQRAQRFAEVLIIRCLPSILWNGVLKICIHMLSFAHSMQLPGMYTLRDKIQGSSIWQKNETFIRTMAAQFWSVLAALFIRALLLDVQDSPAQSLSVEVMLSMFRDDNHPLRDFLDRNNSMKTLIQEAAIRTLFLFNQSLWNYSHNSFRKGQSY